MKTPPLESSYLFMDALGQKFYTPTDPLVYHTMARLVLGTRKKGGIVKPSEQGDKPGVLGIYSYKPRWASDLVESRATFESTSHGDMILGIALKTLSPVTRISFAWQQQENGLTVLKTNTKEQEPLPLDTGMHIDEAAKFVADKAQNFFEQIVKKDEAKATE